MLYQIFALQDNKNKHNIQTIKIIKRYSNRHGIFMWKTSTLTMEIKNNDV